MGHWDSIANPGVLVILGLFVYTVITITMRGNNPSWSLTKASLIALPVTLAVIGCGALLGFAVYMKATGNG